MISLLVIKLNQLVVTFPFFILNFSFLKDLDLTLSQSAAQAIQISYELSFFFSKSNIIITQEAKNNLLSSTGRLNDSIIEGYMLSQASSAKDIYVLPSFTATTLAFSGQSPIRKSNKLSKYSFIAGPVYHEASEHWTLIFIDIKRSFFFYIDPLFSTCPSLGEKVFSNWLLFCDSFDDLKSRNWTFKNIHTSTQTDDYSCGLFVCKFFYHLKSYNYDGLLTPFNDLNTFRKEIDDIFIRLNSLQFVVYSYFYLDLMYSYFYLFSINKKYKIKKNNLFIFC